MSWASHQGAARFMAELNSLEDSDAQRINKVLAESNYADIRRLKCEQDHNSVIISGRLPNFYQKQLAIGMILPCLEKGTTFDDDIEVGRTPRT